jgi:alcohol dehydrogenase class IV
VASPPPESVIRDLTTAAGLPTTLRELGMCDEDIDPVADNVHLEPEQGWSRDDAVHALRLALG